MVKALTHDLSPRARTPDEIAQPQIGGSSRINFEELVGLDVLNASQLFTCERKTTRKLPAPPPKYATWPHRLARDAGLQRSSLSFADIGVGMLVHGDSAWLESANGRHSSSSISASHRSSSSQLRSVRSLCEVDGLLLACARHTWQAAHPDLDVVALVDCIGYGRPAEEIAKLPLNESYDLHTPFHYRPAHWLARSTAPHLTLRCYWGPSGTTVRGWGGQRKTAALLRALRDVLPTKAFYVKIDEDTLLRPTHLLSFLTALHTAVHRESVLYFGSTISREQCSNDRCKMFGFNTAESRIAAKLGSCARGEEILLLDGGTMSAVRSRGHGGGSGGGHAADAHISSSSSPRNCSAIVANMTEDSRVASAVLLREDITWQALEASFLPKSVRSVTRHQSVMGVAGGGYGLNRLALDRIVSTRCLMRVGELRCRAPARSMATSRLSRCRFRRGLVHTYEDNAVGLCMHLIQARPVHCEAFRSYLDSDAAAVAHGSVSSGSNLGKNHGTTHSTSTTHGATKGTRAAGTSAAMNVSSVSPRNEDRPTSALSRFPILLHPLKQPKLFMAWWRMLEARDRKADLDLRAWRERAAVMVDTAANGRAHVGGRNTTMPSSSRRALLSSRGTVEPTTITASRAARWAAEFSAGRASNGDERAITRLVTKFGCTAAYIDVGTNIGVQLRKLFEPYKYRGALAVHVFREVFGVVGNRCRVCAIGVEPNPRHGARLNDLESKLQAAGAPVLVLRGAAATYDGEQQFFMHTNASLDTSANTGFVHPQKNHEKCRRPRSGCEDESSARISMVTVRAMDIARVFKHVARALALQQQRATEGVDGGLVSQSDGRKTDTLGARAPAVAATALSAIIVAKIDVEAAEYEVLPHLLAAGALCNVRHLLVEWHPHVRGDAYGARVRAAVNASLGGRRMIGGSIDGGEGCKLPQMSEVDDNTFIADGKSWPNASVCASTAAQPLMPVAGSTASVTKHIAGSTASVTKHVAGSTASVAARIEQPLAGARGLKRRRGTAATPTGRKSRYVSVSLNLSVPTPGFCRFSEPGWEGDCEHGEQGNWPLKRWPSLNSLEGCVARCRACSRCRYVSYAPRSSSDLGDCSWYFHCATLSGRLSTRFAGFTTVQLRPLEDEQQEQ